MRNLTQIEIENIHGGGPNAEYVVVNNILGTSLGVMTAATAFGVECYRGQGYTSSVITAFAAAYLPIAVFSGHALLQIWQKPLATQLHVS